MRFPGFEGEWESCELGEIAEFSKGAGISKDQRSSDGNPCILYGELYTTYLTEIIDEVVSKTNLDPTGLVRSKANDIIIPASGETAIDISTARCVLQNDVLLGGDLNIIRLFNQDGRFFSYQLNGIRKKDIARIAHGVSIVHLHGNALSHITVNYPSRSEQEKISSLLSLIDQRIAIQNKVIERYESLIKALCHNLIISSKGKVCHIGDILKIGSGKDYKHLNAGSVPVFGTGGYMLSVSDWLYEGESVCIGRKGTINNPFYVEGKFWTVDTLFYTYDFEGVLPKYCYYLFQTIDWLQYNEASGVPSLSKSTIERIRISIPSIDEQAKAVQVLDRVEMAITCWRELLNHYESIKQYLLSQLFI